MTRRMRLVLIVLVSVTLAILGCHMNVPADTEGASRDGGRLFEKMTDTKGENASDLRVIVENVEPAFLETRHKGECYCVTVRFESSRCSEVRLPFAADHVQEGIFIGSMIDYEIKIGEKWVGYWKPGMRAYIFYSLDKALRVPKGQSVVVKFYLPFREQDGNRLTVRLRVDGAISQPFVIDWSRDRDAGRFAAAGSEKGTFYFFLDDVGVK